MAEFVVVWPEMDWNFWLGFLRVGSEKGSTRKHTENWVTSWGFLFWGNLTSSR
jgi:hypothetical protein